MTPQDNQSDYKKERNQRVRHSNIDYTCPIHKPCKDTKRRRKPTTSITGILSLTEEPIIPPVTLSRCTETSMTFILFFLISINDIRSQKQGVHIIDSIAPLGKRK